MQITGDLDGFLGCKCWHWALTGFAFESWGKRGQTTDFVE
jgi:hypothetical protein